MAEAIAVARKINDMHGVAEALYFAACLSHYMRNPAEVERLAADLIELSIVQNFPLYLYRGVVLRGWAWSASNATAEGIACIENGIRDYQATGAIFSLAYFLSLKAEALYFADRTAEALETINEAGALTERYGERWWYAELHRLRGVFLAALDAEENQIEASSCEAIRIANEQKSVSLQKRAEATYAEYRRQKASASGGDGIRLPLR
jgi:predicted ATPase